MTVWPNVISVQVVWHQYFRTTTEVRRGHQQWWARLTTGFTSQRCACRCCYPDTPAMGSGRGHHPHFGFQLALDVRGFPGCIQAFLFSASSKGIAVNHHRRSPGPFKYSSGGGHVPTPTPWDHARSAAPTHRPGIGLDLTYIHSQIGTLTAGLAWRMSMAFTFQNVG